MRPIPEVYPFLPSPHLSETALLTLFLNGWLSIFVLLRLMDAYHVRRRRRLVLSLSLLMRLVLTYPAITLLEAHHTTYIRLFPL